VPDGSAAETWRRRIAEQACSGLSVAAFCARRDWAVPTFYSWKRRLRQTPPARPPRRTKFLPLTATPLAMSISIERPDGLVLRVPCDEEALRLTLRVLDEQPC
jgi:hypothetical protein